MIQRKYDEAAIYAGFAGYANWKVKASDAAKAVQKAIDDQAKPDFDSGIYGQLKDSLLVWFRDKCAYCETLITAASFGDVEHYRPKRKVDEEPSHSGYYWLAYEPSNLMLSCERCNRGRGKRNHFPVRAGTRAFSAAGLAGEVPLLLSPFSHQPGDHLKFDFDDATGTPTGYVQGTTEEGRTSVAIYGLNRPQLVDDRKLAQEQSIDAYVLAKLRGNLDRFIAEFKAGRRDYVAARTAALLGYIEWDRAESARRAAQLGG